MILTDEFARQASMESDLGIKSTLFATPTREILELGKSQLGFMNMFAIPLFQGVTDVLPGMKFCIDELQTNKAVWEKRIAEEHARVRAIRDQSSALTPAQYVSHNRADGYFNGSPSISPFTRSVHMGETTGLSEVSLGTPLGGRELQNSKGVAPESSSGVSSPASTVTGTSTRTPQMSSYVERSFATASGPANDQSDDHLTNGEAVGDSLVTEAVVHEEPATSNPGISIKDHAEHAPQRSSDTTTDASTTTPGSGDWASQATSATTSKIPYSPSTQGTSVMSGDDYQNGLGESSRLDGIGSPPSSRGSMTRRGRAGTNGEVKAVGVTSVIMETKRTLKTKTSRFRLANFWKRHRSRSAQRGDDCSPESANPHHSTYDLPQHAPQALVADDAR